MFVVMLVGTLALFAATQPEPEPADFQQPLEPEIGMEMEVPVIPEEILPPLAAVMEITRGQQVELLDFVEPGYYTVFDFYSEYCPPCVALKPTVEELAEVSDEIVLRVVNINREGHKGIDWKSPVAVQYGMNSIPHFKVYDKDGTLMLEGNAARRWVAEKANKLGIAE